MIRMRPPELGVSLLLIERDDGLRRRLQLLLVGQGYHVLAFSRIAHALDDPATLTTLGLVIDSACPEGHAIDALRRLHEQEWHGRAILIAEAITPAQYAAARAAGFDAVLVKPFRDANLLHALARPAGATGTRHLEEPPIWSQVRSVS